MLESEVDDEIDYDEKAGSCKKSNGYDCPDYFFDSFFRFSSCSSSNLQMTESKVSSIDPNFFNRSLVVDSILRVALLISPFVLPRVPIIQYCAAHIVTFMTWA